MIKKQESMPKKVTIEYENGSTRTYDKAMVMSIKDEGLATEFIKCSHKDFSNIALNFLIVINEMRDKIMGDME